MQNHYCHCRATTANTARVKNKQQSSLLTTKDNNLRTKDTNKKSSISKERDRLSFNNKISKPILKQNTTKTTLTDLTSIVSEIKKRDRSQNQSPILMTTIDSDGIKSVTSAAGTYYN